MKAETMGSRLITVLGVIAILGMVGGGGLVVLGVATLVAAGGGGGDVLGALAALGMALAELILGGVVVVAAALLWRGVSILGKPSGVPPTSFGRRVVVGVLAAAVLLGWITPAALTLGNASAASSDVTLSTIAVGIGLVEAATVYAASALLGRQLGVAMLVIPLLSLALPLWVSSSIAQQRGQQTDYAAQRAHYEERFSEILEGPTIEEVAAQVGDVGAWRLFSGGVRPMERADSWFDRQARLTDLGGSVVRFALVAQCTADFDGGQAIGSISIFGVREADGNPLDSQSLESAVLPCDGQLHVDVSDAVTLPAWDAATLAGAGRDWALVRTSVILGSSSPTGPRELIFPDSGDRWLMFVAVEPAPSVDPLVATVASELVPLSSR